MSDIGGALRSRLQSRLDQLDPRPWTVGIELSDAGAFVVDCARRDAGGHDRATALDCTITLSSRDCLDLMSGVLDPRKAPVYAQIAIDGSVTVATEFGDWLAGNSFVTALPSLGPQPRPTTDYDHARGDLETFGYAIVEGALPERQRKALRRRLIEQAAAEVEVGIADFSFGAARPNQRLWSLVNKGQEFIDLLDHRVIDEFALSSLGEHCLLSGYFSIIAEAGGDARQSLHTDQMGIIPPLSDVNVGLNIVFFLDEFTDANGATRVLPGSHLREHHIAPLDTSSHEGTVAAEGPAGSALIFDSRLWHATGMNKTDQRRHGLFLFFNRQWMRGVENPYFSTHPSILESMSDRLKTFFGLRYTDNLGRVGYSRVGDFVRYAPDELIMKMEPRPPGLSSS